MTWLVLALGVVAFVELVNRCRLFSRVKNLQDVTVKISRVIRSAAISDHWKEKVLLAYARQIFTHSMVIFLLLLVAFSPLAVLAIAANSVGVNVVPLLSGFTGIVAATCMGLGYLFIKSLLIKTGLIKSETIKSETIKSEPIKSETINERRIKNKPSSKKLRG